MEDYRLEQSGQEVQNILDGAAMQTDLTAENERAERAESVLQGNIDDEALARQNADGVLQGKIDDEETRAKAAEKQNSDDIDAIEEKIPNQASSSNQLADKEYVEDLVSTASATFRGTFNLVSDLHLTIDASRSDIAAALGNAIATADNNDYAFVLIPTSVDTPNEIASIEKYKFNGSAWGFEYVLNNSGFTAAQWAAINSGITSALVTKLGALPSASELATALLAKQDKLTFDSAPTPSSDNPVTSGGVYTAIDNEKGARINGDAALQQAIEAILALIPSAATALNQLADKAFVNSSIATATATFRGTYNLVSDLHLNIDASHADIAAALLNAISTADNNDYAFVQIPTSVDTPTEIRVTEKYKFNGTVWGYEYDLNNSGFTALQWAAINSGITALLVEKLGALPTAAELALALAGKQATLTFDNAPVAGSNNPVKSGGLYELFAAIDAKMPAGASANNKLVAEDRLAAYVAAIIGALDASYNVTSSDGHVTVKVTQADGAITSVEVLTSDIASASALTTLTGRVSTNETDIANLQAAYAALTQSDVIIVNGALPSSGQQQNKIYRQPDQEHTPPQFYSDYMWNGSTWVLMATYNNAIENTPTVGSNNLVTSDGIKGALLAIEIPLWGADVYSQNFNLGWYTSYTEVLDKCLITSANDFSAYNVVIRYLSWRNWHPEALYFQLIVSGGTLSQSVPIEVSIPKTTWSIGEWLTGAVSFTDNGKTIYLNYHLLSHRQLTTADSIPVMNLVPLKVTYKQKDYCKNNISVYENITNIVSSMIDVENEEMLSLFNEAYGNYIQQYKVWSNYNGRLQVLGVLPWDGLINFGVCDESGNVLFQPSVAYSEGDLTGIKEYNFHGSRSFNDGYTIYIHCVVNWDLYKGANQLWGVNTGIYLKNNPIKENGWGAYFSDTVVCHGGNLSVTIMQNQGKTIIVESGEYDIIEEYKAIFGSTYFDTYQDYSSGGFPYGAGIPLFNGTKLICSPNAKIVCKYTGDNPNVPNNFSAFACGNGYEIDGMNLECERLRYAIHDDFNTISTQYNVVIKNCHLTHTGQVLGGGLGVCGNYLIENNYFENTFHTVGDYDMRYHNNAGASKNRLTFVGNYFYSRLRICNYGASAEHTTECFVSNSNMGAAILHDNETADPTEENIKVIEWNNFIRS